MNNNYKTAVAEQQRDALQTYPTVLKDGRVKLDYDWKSGLVALDPVPVLVSRDGAVTEHNIIVDSIDNNHLYLHLDTDPYKNMANLRFPATPVPDVSAYYTKTQIETPPRPRRLVKEDGVLVIGELDPGVVMGGMHDSLGQAHDEFRSKWQSALDELAGDGSVYKIKEFNTGFHPYMVSRSVGLICTASIRYMDKLLVFVVKDYDKDRGDGNVVGTACLIDGRIYQCRNTFTISCPGDIAEGLRGQIGRYAELHDNHEASMEAQRAALEDFQRRLEAAVGGNAYSVRLLDDCESFFRNSNDNHMFKIDPDYFKRFSFQYGVKPKADRPGTAWSSHMSEEKYHPLTVCCDIGLVRFSVLGLAGTSDELVLDQGEFMEIIGMYDRIVLLKHKLEEL